MMLAWRIPRIAHDLDPVLAKGFDFKSVSSRGASANGVGVEEPQSAEDLGPKDAKDFGSKDLDSRVASCLACAS